jgi:autotransporter-associated beta strand protein
MNIRTYSTSAPSTSGTAAFAGVFRRPALRGLAALSASVATLLAVQTASAANAVWTGGGADSNWVTAGNWGGVTPTAGDALFFDGVVRLNNNNNLTAGTSFTGITFNSTAGSFTLGGNSITLSGDITNASLNAQTINLPLMLDGTRAMNVTSKMGVLTNTGIISGNFGMTKTGPGLLVLSTATNTFTGPVTVTGGTLSVDNDLRLGAVPAAATPGSIVLDGGTLRISANQTISANRGIALGGAGAGTGGTIDLSANSSTVTYGGILANNGGANGLIKTGSGLLVLGGANTYTGSTTINQGAIRLDFNQTTAPATNIINPASTLVMGGVNTSLGNPNSPLGAQTNNVGPFSAANPSGGTILNVTSKSAADSAQTFASVTFNAGLNTISTVQTSAGNVLLNLGAMTRNAGAIANLNLAGTLSAANAIKTSTANNAQGIIGPWASYNGTDYAANDGSGNVVAYTGYTPVATGAIADGASTNVRLTNATNTSFTLTGTPDGVVNINTLSLNAAGLATINLAFGDTLRLGAAGGVLVGSGAGSTGGIQIGNAVSQGRLTAGDSAQTTGGEITFLTYGSKGGNPHSLRVNAVIANNNALTGVDNSTGGNAVSVTIGGTMGNGNSVTELFGSNTYSGGTTIATGRVNVNNVSALGTGPVTVLNGGQAFLASAGTYVNDFNITGAGTSNNSNGFDTPSALRVGGNTTLTGAITLLNDAAINFRNSNGAVLAGKISGGYNLTLTANGAGGGNVTLSNPANNWTGNTHLDQKQVLLGESEVIPNGAGFGNVILANTANTLLDLNGRNETINGLVSGGANPFVQNRVADTVSTLTLGDGNATATYGGVIRNNDGIATGGTLAITKVGTGVQVFSSNTAFTYSGDTNINGGVLNVAGTGGLNPLGNVLINATATSAGELRSASIVGNVTLGANNGANIAHLNPGAGAIGGGSVGTLTLSSLTVNGGAIDMDLTPLVGTNDRLQVNGQVAFAAPSTISLFGIASSGTYTLIDSINPITYAVDPTFSVQTIGRPATVAIDKTDALKLQIVVTSGAGNLKWTGAIDSNWDNQITSNWMNGNVADKFLAGDNVTFDNTAANKAVNLVGTLLPGSVTVNDSADYTFAGTGVISGTTALTKVGSGRLIVGNANSFSGGTTISAGTVQLNDGGSLGSATVTNNGALVLNHSGNGTFANVISGSGQLQKTGVGVTTLSGNSGGFAGSTEISGGALSITSSLSGLLSIVTSATSAGELRGTGFVDEVMMTASNGANVATLSPGTGGVNSVGTLTLSSLMVNGGNLIFDVGAATSIDRLAVSSTLNFAGASTITLNPTVPPVNGVITLATASAITYGVDPVLVGNAGQFRPATYTLDKSDPAALQVNVTSGSLDITWKGNVSSAWDVNATTNWQDSAAAVQKFYNGDRVLFDNTATNFTVTLASPLVPGAVTVNNTTDYVFNGTGFISGSTSLVKRGAGKLILSNPNTYSGGTTIEAGTLQLEDAGALGSGPIENAGALVINNGATNLTLNGVINGVGTVAKTGAGTVNLNNASSTYSGGTTISAGTVIFGQNSSGSAGGAVTNGPLGTGLITLSGGTLNTNGKTIFNNLFAAPNTSSTLDAAVANAVLNGNLSGSGTVTLRNTSATNLSFTPGLNNAVDWSGFTGRLIHLQGVAGVNNVLFRQANSTVDLSNAIVELQNPGGTTNTRFAADETNLILKIGALTGSSGNLGANLPGAQIQVGFLNTDTTFGGNIAEFSATSVFEKVGTGTLTLSGPNSQNGIFVVSQGTLTGTGGTPLGGTGGALVVRNTNNTGPGTNTVLNLSTAAPTTKGSLSGGIATPTSGTNTATINNGGQLLTINQTVSDQYSGRMIGSGGFTLGTASTQTLALSGTNTYTGPTTVNSSVAGGAAGTLLFKQKASLPKAPASLTAADLVVNARATLAISVGGTGEFTLADFDTLKSLSAPGGGFQAGSLIGIDVNNPAERVTYAGIIADTLEGALGFAKVGPGSLALSGDHTYTGPTRIDAGALVVDGSISGSFATVNGVTALLGGSGTMGPVNVGALGGTIAPGALSAGGVSSIGTLNSSSVSLSAGAANAHLSLQLGASTGGAGSSDRLNVVGTVDVTNSDLALSSAGLNAAFGDIFYLVLNDELDPVIGQFGSYFNGSSTVSGSLAEGSVVRFGNQDFTLTYAAESTMNSFFGGNDIALQAVPEPSTFALMVGSLALLGGARRRRKMS